jgi:hypothetical protein
MTHSRSTDLALLMAKEKALAGRRFLMGKLLQGFIRALLFLWPPSSTAFPAMLHDVPLNLLSSAVPLLLGLASVLVFGWFCNNDAMKGTSIRRYIFIRLRG